VIIGLLAGLGTRAAFQAMQAAKRASILSEIGQLDMALGDYKTKANSFPPCMGDVNVNSRQSRFYTHVIRAFPRYVSVRSYRDMQVQIVTNFQGAYGSYYDLDMMDQAEALVFWLGGFPTPRSGGSATGSLLGSSKLFGFCTSPTQPFFDQPTMPMGVFTAKGTTSASTVLNPVDRTPPGFQFDEGRLVDQDGDGWLEYIPVGIIPPGTILTPGSPSPFAPYVYFDADLYVQQTTASATVTYKTYPGAAAGPNVPTWGLAMPYAGAAPTSATSQLTWINPRKFQIISAGMDNYFGLMGAPYPAPPATAFPTMPKVYPAGYRYDTVSSGDSDNLTNFADRQLGDAL
jgi:hypothetical protein